MLVDYEFYTKNGYSLLNENNATQYLSKAERQINTLCYNRLYDGSYEKLTIRSQEVVKIIICEHAEYLSEYEEGELPYGTLKSYKNGNASFTFDNSISTVLNKSDIGIKADLYSELCMTGLCYRGLC